MNVRNGVAAAALLSLTVLTVGCATQTAGTASVGKVAVTVSDSAGSTTASGSPTTSSSAVIPTSAEPSTPSSDSTSSDSTSSDSTSSEATSSSTEETESDTSVPDTGSSIEPVDLDATTQVWLETSCTDIGTLLATLFDLPTVDQTAPVEEFRAAYRDYYASLADTLLEMTGRLSQLDPPQIDNGQALHDGYLQYLIKLADIAGSGSIAIDEAPADAQAIADIVEHIQFDTERLGESDLGLSDFQGEQLQALMAQVPECADLVGT